MLRPYEPDDLPAILDAWYQASLVAHSFLSADFLEEERARIADQWIPMADVTVYEVNDSVVGFIAMIGNEVGGLFVHPDFQRRGVGRALLDGVRDAHPHLVLNVFESNRIGRSFYASYGFREIGSHVNEATALPELRLRYEGRVGSRGG